MNKLCKKLYAVQPYLVGPTKKKSLAVIIPAKLAKKYGVDTSTIFATYVDQNDHTISLRMIRAAYKNTVAPTGPGLSASQEQAIKEPNR